MTQVAFGRRAPAPPPRFGGAPGAPAPAPALPKISLAPDTATAAMEDELAQWKKDWNRRRLARFKTARWIGGASGVLALGCQFLLPDPIGDWLSTALGVVSFGAFIAGFGRKKTPVA
jgi:hypothetical protein